MKIDAATPVLAEVASVAVTAEKGVQQESAETAVAIPADQVEAVVRFESERANSELTARIQTMEAEHASAIQTLTATHEAALAAAVQRAETAEAEITRRDSEVAAAALREARVEQVEKIPGYPTDFATDERANIWSAMDEETWNTVVESFTAAWANNPVEAASTTTPTQRFAPVQTNGKGSSAGFYAKMREEAQK